MRSSCNNHAGVRRNTASSRRPTSTSCRAGSSRLSLTAAGRRRPSASAMCVSGSRAVWSCRSARATSAICSAWSGRCLDSGAMVTMSSEYSIYLYREKVDLRKGISGLSGIVRAEMRLNPNTAKSIYVFSGRNFGRKSERNAGRGRDDDASSGRGENSESEKKDYVDVESQKAKGAEMASGDGAQWT